MTFKIQECPGQDGQQLRSAEIIQQYMHKGLSNKKLEYKLPIIQIQKLHFVLLAFSARLKSHSVLNSLKHLLLTESLGRGRHRDACHHIINIKV